MPITLSESAAKEIRSIIKDQGLPEDATRLRVGVKGGGCSGFSYMLDLVEDAPAESDEQLESNGVKIVCDMKSYLYLNGANRLQRRSHGARFRLQESERDFELRMRFELYCLTKRAPAVHPLRRRG